MPELIAGVKARMQAEGERRAAKTVRPWKPPLKRFSTQAAIDWGRAQGWKLIEREGYDHRTGKFHDLMLGVDALFDCPTGIVGIQGAGRSQRTDHYERFLNRGGVATAVRRHIAVVYLEFERGNPDPLSVEWWVGGETCRACGEPSALHGGGHCAPNAGAASSASAAASQEARR